MIGSLLSDGCSQNVTSFLAALASLGRLTAPCQGRTARPQATFLLLRCCSISGIENIGSLVLNKL